MSMTLNFPFLIPICHPTVANHCHLSGYKGVSTTGKCASLLSANVTLYNLPACGYKGIQVAGEFDSKIPAGKHVL